MEIDTLGKMHLQNIFEICNTQYNTELNETVFQRSLPNMYAKHFRRLQHTVQNGDNLIVL